MPIDKIDTDLLCLFELLPSPCVLAEPGAVVRAAFTGTLRASVGRAAAAAAAAAAELASGDRRSVDFEYPELAGDVWLGNSNFQRSRALVGPLRADSLVAGVLGEVDRRAVFLKVMVHLTSSPANTVELAQSTDISILGIIVGAVVSSPSPLSLSAAQAASQGLVHSLAAVAARSLCVRSCARSCRSTLRGSLDVWCSEHDILALVHSQSVGQSERQCILLAAACLSLFLPSSAPPPCDGMDMMGCSRISKGI